MKKNLRPPLYILIFLWIMTGCVNQTLDECPPEIPEPDVVRRLLTITAYDVLTGEDVTTTEQLDNVALYLFDSDGELQYILDVPVSDVVNRIPVDITYTGLKNGFATVWSNLNDDVSLIDDNIGEDIEAMTLVINEDELADQEEELERGFFVCPGDLFFGYVPFDFTTATRQNIDIIRDVPIKRKNARLNITVRGLEDTTDADDYYFRISTLWNGYDFEGDPQAMDYFILQAGDFNTNGDLISPDPYMMIHAEPDMLYSDDRCVQVGVFKRDENRVSPDRMYGVAFRDVNGEYINFESGKTTNVLIVIDERGDVEMRMVVTPWNEIHQWTVW